MFNLNFIEELESGKESLVKNRDLYIKIKNAILEAQREGMAIAEGGEKLTDENSKEYIELVEKANKIKERINNLGKDLRVVQKRFEKVKQYIIENLIKNKEIIEKYKDVKDDKELNEFKDKLKDMDINKERLDDKISKVTEQINLNNLSKEEINKLNQKKRKEALNAREQYLNNKRELEKLEKIKYITILEGEEPKKRIFQYESAIAYIDKQFSIENIEGVIEKLEETLGIQKQKPQVKFDLKTHTYTFIDERGKETVFKDLFKKDEDSKYKNTLTDVNMKATKQWAEEHGLSKGQIKAIDYNVVKVLQTDRPDLLNSYLEAIKEGKEADFAIEYNFKRKGIDKEEKIDRKELRKIKTSARRQKMRGMATIIKDKVKFKIAGVLAVLGLTGVATAIAGHDSKLVLNEGKVVEPIIGEELGNNINSKINEEKNTLKDENKEIQAQNEITVGNYIKIAQGAMLFDNPTDELRIMNGLNATEKVQVKQSGMDRIYKINKEGYYSLNGDYVTIEVGKNLDEALKKKGLDKSFVEEGNSVKMYHAVSDGISQWVRADDVEKVEIRTDKFGNPIDKTEEQKMADEAMENYYKQKDTKKEHTNTSNKSVQANVVNNEDKQEKQQNVNDTEYLEEDVVKEEKDVLKQGVKHKDSEEGIRRKDNEEGMRHKDSEEGIRRKNSEEGHKKHDTDNKVVQDIDNEKISRDTIDNDYIEHDENDNFEVVTFERYEGDVISQSDFRKQYREDVKKQYENRINNKNVVIDVEAEIIDDEER